MHSTSASRKQFVLFLAVTMSSGLVDLLLTKPVGFFFESLPANQQVVAPVANNLYFIMPTNVSDT